MASTYILGLWYETDEDDDLDNEYDGDIPETDDEMYAIIDNLDKAV
jgi:hypothetical protein